MFLFLFFTFIGFAQDPTHVFFIHGANVSEQDARAWASEMFKRLWHAGADIEFYVVANDTNLEEVEIVP